MIPKNQLVTWLAVSMPVVAVLAFAKGMAPVREGDAATFWQGACGIDVEGKKQEVMGSVYLPRDNWYIYYIQRFHGQLLFRVPRSQAEAAFPAVVQGIKASTSRKDAAPKVLRAAAALERSASGAEPSPEQFLRLAREEWLKELLKGDKSVHDYAVSEEDAFAERWVRIRHYWMNLVFEGTFFGGLTLFALWPWLRRGGSWSWGFHLGFLPVLLMLPYYCGYAPWTFTSAGPTGGVLYPWVIVWLRGIPIWTLADEWALEHLPRFLEPLSQPPGPMLAVSGGHGLGPVTALAVGAGVGICFSASVRFAMRQERPTADPSTVESGRGRVRS